MNIYFACSITGGRDFEPIYQAIMAALLADGHTVPTAHLAGSDVLALEAIASPRAVYERDIAWISGCDALVAEVSTPSHGRPANLKDAYRKFASPYPGKFIL